MSDEVGIAELVLAEVLGSGTLFGAHRALLVCIRRGSLLGA